jgi:hypothetical protein
MRIFTPENSIDGRINFVDEDNVYVGYELHVDCCEQPGWFFTRKFDARTEKILQKAVAAEDKDIMDSLRVTVSLEELEQYRFKIDAAVKGTRYCGYRVITLQNVATKKYLYLVLYNLHNGYYAHELLIKDVRNVIVLEDRI